MVTAAVTADKTLKPAYMEDRATRAPSEEEATAAFELILRETTTLGVRTRPVERYVAERRSESMESVLGVISVKVKYLGGKAVSASPEYEDCREIALESGISLQDVYQQAMAEARRQYLV